MRQAQDRKESMKNIKSIEMRERKMYFTDFFKRMTRKANVPTLIYLVLNVFIIVLAVYAFIGTECMLPIWLCALIGVGLYALSLMIALSPVGEWILRKRAGCKKIERVEQINLIEPLFREVYGRAKRIDPSIPDDVQLFMNDDEDANAFATGRKTICITRGLMDAPPAQIKATLGHEFGHLAHKDTDLILIVCVGNMIVNAIIICIRVFIEIFHILGIAFSFAFGSDSLLALIGNELTHWLTLALFVGLTKLWSWIGTMLVMKSSRANEFEADEFSYRIGYGNALCALLDNIGGAKPQGLFATLASSHPDKDARIARLQAMGASYRTNYYLENNQ